MRWSALVAMLVGCAPFQAGEGPVLLDRATERDTDVVRVVTWNIETVGSPGSVEYDDALALLDRIRPDVLALNEIADSDDADHAEWLAVDAGFDHYVVGDAAFGADRNAILSVFPLEDAGGRTASEISGDWRANDITRDFVVATVQTPGGPLDVVSMHWKSGWDDTDEFRRVLESHRAAQLIDPDRPAVLTGDWNEDYNDGADWPYVFHSMPSGLPGSLWLGGDLWSELQDEGLPNDVFGPLEDAGLVIHEIRQRSGTDATRPISGRRLDYIATTADLEVRDAEVFDCRDQHRPGIELYNSPVPNATCPSASDHLPVIADIVVGEVRPVEPVGVDVLTPGDLVVSEILANPDACPDSTGEWVEIRNHRSEPVSLVGLELVDASGNSGVVGEGEIAPGGLAVLGRGDTPCGPSFAATYGSGVSLNNGGDSLTLGVGGLEIDSVAYGSSDAGAGQSWSAVDDCVGAPSPGTENTCAG